MLFQHQLEISEANGVLANVDIPYLVGGGVGKRVFNTLVENSSSVWKEATVKPGSE